MKMRNIIVSAIATAIAATSSAITYDSVNILVDPIGGSGSDSLSGSSYWDYPTFTGTSTIEIASGNFDYSRFRVNDNSTLIMSGGSVDGNIEARGDAMISFSGGESEFSTSARDNSKIELHSGKVRVILGLGSSQINYFGGDVSLGFMMKENSNLTVFGSNINYVFQQYYNYSWGPYNKYLLSGLNANGEWFETNLSIYDGYTGSIDFKSVPDTGSSILFMGLSLSAVVGVRRFYANK